jgi:tetratricopeptide (TPR) repeat protein
MLVFPDPLSVGTASSAAAAQALFSLAAAALKGENARSAVSVSRAGLVLAPEAGPAWGNLMSAWRRAGRIDQAVGAARRALVIMPESAEIRLALAIVLAGDRTAPDQARRVAALAPDLAIAWFQIGKLASSADAGRRCYLRALRIRPDWSEARMNLGLLQLHLGELDAGWSNTEARWIVPGSGATMRLTRPLWRGEPLDGKRLAVLMEQGVGDLMLYAGALPDLLRRGGRVLVESDPRLVSLLGRSLPTATVVPTSDARLHQVDAQIPIGGLMRLFRPNLESFRARKPYLAADPHRTQIWRRRLDALGPGRKIGISWRSSRGGPARDDQLTRIEDWAPVLDRAHGDVFVSLQYDHRPEELEAARHLSGVELHAWKDLDQKNDFESVAALMANLDLVITVMTSVCHLAGGLGRPLWVLCPPVWPQLGTDGVPFHPQARCFIKPAGAGWAETMGRVAAALDSP